MPINYRIAEEFGENWCPELPDDVIERPNWWLPSYAWSTWIRNTFIQGDTRLHNEDHAHLRAAQIGVLLTSCENTLGGKRVVGQAEMPRPKPGWSGARAEYQLEQWFGVIPDFIITLDAKYLLKCSPARLCSTVEHELYHCGHARDLFGAPRFSKKTGKPIFYLRPHDVEEFVGCWRRYGPRRGAGASARLWEAGNEPYLFEDDDVIDCCCGTCGQ
jgi:hypothetical protein